MSLAFEVAAQTDVGCVRVRNEDSFGYDLDRGIFIVCDGMGGHAAGDVASQLAVDSLLSYFRRCSLDEAHCTPLMVEPAKFSNRSMALGEAIQLANSAICDAATRDEKCAGMGSTVVGVLANENLVSVGHVGDSRAYLIRGGLMQQLTRDHSFVAEGVQRGLISEEQAKESTLQNIITQALGSKDTVEPDLDDILAVSGDILMLATDGLTRALSNDEILRVIDGATELREACDCLIQAAKAAGGDDNITCMLIRFVGLPWYESCRRRIMTWRAQ